MTLHHLDDCPTPEHPGETFAKAVGPTSEAVVTRCPSCRGYDPATLRQRPRRITRVVVDPATGATIRHNGPATDTDAKAWAIAERLAMTEPGASTATHRAGRARVERRAAAAADEAYRNALASGATPPKARASAAYAAEKVRAAVTA